MSLKSTSVTLRSTSPTHVSFFFNGGESGTRNWNFAKLLSQIFTISETLSYLTQKPNIIQHFPQFFNFLFQSTLSLKKLLNVFFPAHHLYHYYGSGGNHKSTRISKVPPDQSLSIFVSYIYPQNCTGDFLKCKSYVILYLKSFSGFSLSSGYPRELLLICPFNLISWHTNMEGSVLPCLHDL